MAKWSIPANVQVLSTGQTRDSKSACKFCTFRHPPSHPSLGNTGTELSAPNSVVVVIV